MVGEGGGGRGGECGEDGGGSRWGWWGRVGLVLDMGCGEDGDQKSFLERETPEATHSAVL